MNTKNKLSWFTFVELVVTIVILSILSAVWFYSYIWYLWEARDSQRSSDLAKIWSSLKLYKQKRGSYPIPWNNYNITNSWFTVAKQWKLDNNVSLSTLDKLPIDPSTGTYYSYSITNNKQEYQLALTFENDEEPITWLIWDYKTVSKNVLPNIILAKDSTTDIEIHSWVLDGATNRNYFLFNSSTSLPYELIDPYIPYYNESLLDDVLIDPTTDFWQNSDYRSCIEIEDSWKMISWSWYLEEYQILNNSWILTNTWCTF